MHLGLLFLGQIGSDHMLQAVNARIRTVQQSHDIQQGRLTRAGWTHDGDILPGLYGKRHPVQSIDGHLHRIGPRIVLDQETDSGGNEYDNGP